MLGLQTGHYGAGSMNYMCGHPPEFQVQQNVEAHGTCGAFYTH